MATNLLSDNIWLNKWKYDDAENQYYTCKLKEIQTPLADEVARARKMLKNIRNSINETQECWKVGESPSSISVLQEQYTKFAQAFSNLEQKLDALGKRVGILEERFTVSQKVEALDLNTCKKMNGTTTQTNDDDVDLFASDSDEETDAAKEVREKRLADYQSRKSKKPVLIAKSNIILDVKPWSDETNLQVLEAEVRKINTQGLLWGASKLVPLAYGIHKLQISCVIEDDLVSVDWLQEQIEAIEEYVQSVDIAAFNKV